MHVLLKRISLVFIALVLLFAAAGAARACSCGAGYTVDNKYKDAQVVGIFKLRSILKTEAAEQSPANETAIFTVEKVFKGNIKPGQEIPFDQTVRTSCSLVFTENSVGEEFLLYENPDRADGEKLWAVSYCSGWRPLKDAGGDILFLEKLPAVRGKTRLSGRVAHYADSVRGERDFDVLANSPVTLRAANGKITRLKTDENGYYEVYGLAPGKYEVTAAKIKGFAPLPMSAEKNIVEIKAKGHTEADINFDIDNSIKGRVVGPGGKPMKRADVRLLRAGGLNERIDSMDTDDTGTFAFERIPAGEYVVVVNQEGQLSADNPFKPVYYPSTGDRAEAGRISIGPGDAVKGIVITISNLAEVVTLTGVVLYEDGTPAREMRVEFFREFDGGRFEEDGDEYTHTDARGRFTLRVLKDTKGAIGTSRYVYKGDLGDCPKSLEAFKKMESASDSLETFTNRVTTSSVGDQTGIELRFPIPYCKGMDYEDTF